MARQYAKLFVSAIDDPDWTALPMAAQWLYVTLCRWPGLTSAGVCPWQPRQWARTSSDMTEDDVRTASVTLSERGFIVVDDDTEEVLLRTFVRHDGGLKNPNLAKAVDASIAAIRSATLREYATDERHGHSRRSDAIERASGTPSPTPSERRNQVVPHLKQQLKHQLQPQLNTHTVTSADDVADMSRSALLPVPPAAAGVSTDEPMAVGFDTVAKAWPKRGGLPQARTEWRKALQRHGGRVTSGSLTVACLDHAKAFHAHVDARHWPALDRWLARDGFLDQPAAAAPSATTASKPSVLGALIDHARQDGAL